MQTRRLQASGGTVVYQGDAAETPGAGEELILSDLSSGQIVAGGSVSVSSLTITQTASYA